MKILRRVAKGIAVEISFSLIAQVSQLLTISFAVYKLGNEGYGLWVTGFGLLSLIQIFDLPLDQYLIKENSNEKSSQYKKIALLRFVLLGKIINATIVCTIGLLVSSWEFLITKLGLMHNLLELKLLSLYLGVYIVFSILPAMLTIDHRYSQVSFVSNSGIVLAAIVTTVLLEFDYQIFSFIYGLFAGLFLQAAVFAFVAFKSNLFGVSGGTFLADVKIRDVIKYSIIFQSFRIVSLARLHLPINIIAYLFDPALVGRYSINTKLSSMAPNWIAKVSLPFMPSFSNQIKNNLLEARALFTLASKIVVRLSLVGYIIIWFSMENFIELWIGKDLFFDDYALALILLPTLFICLTSVAGVIVFSVTSRATLIAVFAFELVATSLLSFLLNNAFGFFGLLVGISAPIIITQVYIFLFTIEILTLDLRGYFLEMARYALLPTLSSLAGVWVFSFGTEGAFEIIETMFLAIVFNVTVFELMLYFKSEGDGLERLRNTFVR
ncbi:hypothetical protein N9E24_00035 [Alphaproteobacteria bacterium]|nr:hypothetical protein [Alphaproteobacteria bacterium]